jgi:hydroxymethylbilane synthase
VPIACYAELTDSHNLRVRALVGSVDGSLILEDEISGPRESAEQLGIELAERLLSAGAGAILAEVYGSD